LFLETDSGSEAHAGLELSIFLPWPSECWCMSSIFETENLLGIMHMIIYKNSKINAFFYYK
jgi:hypothetical protein